MNRQIEALAALAMASLLMLGAARAEDAPPLSKDALARCAAQIQLLRDDSARLTQQNDVLDERRVVINQRRAALDAERAALSAEDLAKGLDFHQRVKLHQADAVAFNADIDQIKREIAAVNQLKNDYDRQCSDRPYRRADLDAMPEAAREAMRGGMAGVRVPYIE